MEEASVRSFPAAASLETYMRSACLLSFPCARLSLRPDSLLGGRKMSGFEKVGNERMHWEGGWEGGGSVMIFTYFESKNPRKWDLSRMVAATVHFSDIFRGLVFSSVRFSSTRSGRKMEGIHRNREAGGGEGLLRVA